MSRAQPRLRSWSAVLLLAIYLAGFAVAARLLLAVEDRDLLPWNIALLAVFFALFTLIWARPGLTPPLRHVVVATECLVVLALLLLRPESDYATSFFALLAYQVALAFPGRVRWIWVGVLVVLIAGSLMITLGAGHGLGLGLTTMAVAVALPALALASRELEESRSKSRMIIRDLEATNYQLREYAATVEALAVVEERNRLARELHDSVSQAVFSIQLATRSAEIMLRKDPRAVEGQLEELQTLTQEALARMRGFIAELRPPTT